MIYLPELYYLQDQKDFPFQEAVRVTATVISRWSSHFYAKEAQTRSYLHQ